MKTLLSLALVLGSMVALHGEWTTDYKAALATAKAEKKLVLLNFSGGAECPACVLLDRDVFSKKSFQDFANKNYVLVTLDFSDEAKETDALKAENSDLYDHFNVEGFPSLIVVDANGKELGRQLGYHPGTGADAMIAKLKSFNK
jgi:thioredoxin-related protein